MSETRFSLAKHLDFERRREVTEAGRMHREALREIVRLYGVLDLIRPFLRRMDRELDRGDPERVNIERLMQICRE